jgi:hypothetical protein
MSCCNRTLFMYKLQQSMQQLQQSGFAQKLLQPHAVYV